MIQGKILYLKSDAQQYIKRREIMISDYVFCPGHFGTLKVLKDRSGKLGTYIRKSEYPELFL